MPRLPLVVAAWALTAGVCAAAAPPEGRPSVRLVPFEGPITGPSSQRIVRAIADADAAGDTLVLLELDTPGGLVDATEDAVKAMLAAKTLIVVWVGPAGARAASGGFLLLMAADVAAMAPGTRTGVASVISLFGPNPEDDVVCKKAQNDVAAGVRSIAEQRGRNGDAAERAVQEAAAFTEKTALAEGLVDLVVPDRVALLRALDGRTVRRFGGTTLVLRTAGARETTSEVDWMQRALEFLGRPEVAGLLLLLGLGGLYLEFTTPGVVIPGVVGVVALVLFAVSASILPISALAVLLVLTALVLFVLELKIVSHGLLTAAGLAALIAGALLLVEVPELRLPLGFVLPTTVAVAVLCAVAVRLAVRAQRSPVGTGVEGMRGETGTVMEALAPEGKVFVHGELWNAVAASGPLPAGTRVRVTDVRNLRLTVEPESKEGG
jgi:membrane-bound serine protease (ClpP class)